MTRVFPTTAPQVGLLYFVCGCLSVSAKCFKLQQSGVIKKESGELPDTTVAHVPPWAMDFRSVAVAVVDAEGGIAESNQGFLAVLAELGADNARVRLVEPDPAALKEAELGPDGLAYTGAIALSDSTHAMDGISARIYRLGSMWLVAAELDAAPFQRELADARRRLAQRDQALQKAQEEIEALKRQDSLTGLANRPSLDERISLEITRWERYRRPLGLLVMAMDDFDAVNETYGREVSDELLCHVATMLNRSLRTTDLVARYGGLEFAIVLSETNEVGALILAERLRMELENLIILPMVRPLTASFGVATLLPGEGRQELYARVGRAVAHSKNNGRNCVTMAGVIDACDQLYQASAGKT